MLPKGRERAGLYGQGLQSSPRVPIHCGERPFALTGKTKPLSGIDTKPHRFPPSPVLQMPTKGFFNAVFKFFLGTPSQFRLEPTRIDGVALIVPRPVGD